MIADTVEAVVERLIAARVPGAPRVAADAILPGGFEEAYRIQAGVAARLGPVGGFKCGRRTADAIPKLAPVFASDIHADGAELPVSASGLRLVELEIAFRLTSPPPAVDDAHFERRLRERVEVLPALEVVDSRLRDFTAADEAWQLADNQNNGAIILGTPLDALDSGEFVARGIRLVIGDRELHTGSATFPGGDAFATFTAFVRALGTHCGGLDTGQVCITGALSGPHDAFAGDRIHGEIDGLGTVNARFEDPAPRVDQRR